MTLPVDPSWSYVSNLIHCDGVVGSSKIVDEKGLKWVLQGAPISDNKTLFGLPTLSCAGAATAPKISTTFALPGDFTLEIFVNPSPANTQLRPVVFGVADSTAVGFWLCAVGTGSGKANFYVGAISTTTPFLASTSNIPVDSWTHLAITKAGTTWRLFVNGVLEATATSAQTINISSTASLGSGQLGGVTYGYFGNLSNFRFTNGVCRYTENFTVPTAPFPHSGAIDSLYDNVVLQCHHDGENGSTVFSDRKGHALTTVQAAAIPTISTNLFKWGGSSLFTPSVSSAITNIYAQGSDLSPEGRDFCAEGFAAFAGGTSANVPVFSIAAADGVTQAISVCVNGFNSTFTLIVNGSVVYTSASLSANVMHYWCLVRRSGSLFLYLNGASVHTRTISGNVSSNGRIYLLGFNALAWQFPLYIEEFRYTVGSMRYAGTPSVPTDPFPNYGPRKMTGTVRDSAGNPIARTVRSYRSSDGLLVDSAVSDGVTGAFSLLAVDLSEHFVVVHDPVKNALVYDHIAPVL